MVGATVYFIFPCLIVVVVDLKIWLRWYAKRFFHPDIVSPYDYLFIWDEDLGVEHFDAEE